MNSYIKSIMPVQHHGKWVVRVRLYGASEKYLAPEGSWTVHQAQIAADSLRRDVANHGASALDSALA